MEITVSRATIRRVLFVTLALVAFAGLASEVLKSALKLSGRRGLVPMFSLSYDNFVYAAIDWVEESLEMLGVNLFLLSLLSHLGAERYTIGFSKEPARQAPEEGSLGPPEPKP